MFLLRKCLKQKSPRVFHNRILSDNMLKLHMNKKRKNLLLISILLSLCLSACGVVQENILLPSATIVTTTVPTDGNSFADAMYQYSVGVLLRLNGETDKAISALEKAISADPNSSYLVVELVSLYAEKGDLEKAIALGEKEICQISG